MAKKKTLMETLEGMNKKQYVKIGCKDGCNFFYVGTVEDAIELMPDICTKCDTAIRNSLQRQKRTYAARKRDLKKAMNESKPDNLVDACIEKAYTCLQIVRKLQAAVNFYEQVGDRTVLEMYDAIDMPAVCIILPGIDAGKYWNLAEYNASPDSLKVERRLA